MRATLRRYSDLFLALRAPPEQCRVKNNRLNGGVMDTLQDRGHKEDQRLRLEADLAASIDTLFRRCPSLFGFSVQQASKVTRERAVDHLEGICTSPTLPAIRCSTRSAARAVRGRLAHPARYCWRSGRKAELLSGRTFARTLH